jgi:hypothetical protein
MALVELGLRRSATGAKSGAAVCVRRAQHEPDLFELSWSKPFGSPHRLTSPLRMRMRTRRPATVATPPTVHPTSPPAARRTLGSADESPDDFERDGYDVMPMGTQGTPGSAAAAAVCPIGTDRLDFAPTLKRGGPASRGRRKRAVECIDPASSEVLCAFDSQRAAARHLCIPQSAPSPLPTCSQSLELHSANTALCTAVGAAVAGR